MSVSDYVKKQGIRFLCLVREACNRYVVRTFVRSSLFSCGGGEFVALVFFVHHFDFGYEFGIRRLCFQLRIADPVNEGCNFQKRS